MTSRTKFWIVLGALHGAFLVFQVVESDPLLGDSVEYLYAAQNLAESGTLYASDLDNPLEPRYLTKRPVLYPALLVATGAYSGVFLPVLLLQNLLSLFNIYLVLRLFSCLKSIEYIEWIVLGLVALFPSQLIYSNMIMSEILLQTLLVAAVFSLSMYVLEGNTWGLVLYNVMLGAAALTKPVMYLFVLPNLVWMSYLAWRWRDIKCITFALVPLLVVVGTCTINLQRTGLWHFSSIQSASLLDYNTRYLLTQTDGAEAADSLVAAVHTEAEEAHSFAERQGVLHAGAWDLLRPRLVSYVLFHVRGVGGFFLDPGRFDLSNFFGIDAGTSLLREFSADGIRGIRRAMSAQPVLPLLVLLTVAFGNVLKIVGLLIVPVAEVRTEIKWSVLLIIGYVAAATGPIGAARFAVPVFPLIILAVLFAISHLVELHSQGACPHIEPD